MATLHSSFEFHASVVIASVLTLALLPLSVSGATPELHIKLKHHSAMEQRKKDQIERLARLYDLEKYTVTCEIVIDERTKAPHCCPVLTFGTELIGEGDPWDYLALQVYVHEQGHWVVLKLSRAKRRQLLDELRQLVPGLPTTFPEGAGNETDTYIHLAVIMLEWQGLEDLVGPQRAQKIMDWNKTNNYIAIRAAVSSHRRELEDLLSRYDIRF